MVKPAAKKIVLYPIAVGTYNNPERLAFLLHRWTGIILVIYFLLHAPAQGVMFAGIKELAPIAMPLSSGLMSKPVQWIVAVSAVYHGLNGIRLILVEALGLGIGKPELPKPPYIAPSLRASQRLLVYEVFALTVVLAVYITALLATT